MTRPFSRVDGQGAGLKELRLTRELWLRCETRVYFGNGVLVKSETVVVGEQGGGENCGRTRDEVPRKPRGSRLGPAPPYPTLTLFPRLSTTDILTKCRNNSSSSSFSSVSTNLVGLPSILNLGITGESAVGKSRCLLHSYTRPPRLETHPPPVWFLDSSKISLTITGKAPSEVRIARVFKQDHRQRIPIHRSRILDPDRNSR